jgi:pentatricopeptide repeat protein
MLHMMADDGGCFPPNMVSYSTVNDGLCKAQEVLQQMLDKGVIPNYRTYNTLVGGYCSSGQWTEAIRVSKEMSRNGFGPDVFTCNLLMDYLCKKGLCGDARKIFLFHGQGPKT